MGWGDTVESWPATPTSTQQPMRVMEAWCQTDSLCFSKYLGERVAQRVKNLPANAGDARDRGSVPG